LLKQPVALKFLTDCDDTTQKERFIREARLWSTLIHPNIAVVFKAGWDWDGRNGRTCN
jgi:hypothetical protein